MLQRTEHIQCTNLLHADGGPLDCRLAYDSWVRAREKYATIAPSVKDIPMGAVTIFRPENVRRPLGQAPRFCCAGDGTQPVQGLFFTPNVIHVAHERVIYCEALHYFAFVSGDAGWIVTGHNEPGDVLHFPCWQVVEQEYLTQ